MCHRRLSTQQWGLVAEVVPAAECVDAAIKCATTIANFSKPVGALLPPSAHTPFSDVGWTLAHATFIDVVSTLSNDPFIEVVSISHAPFFCTCYFRWFICLCFLSPLFSPECVPLSCQNLTVAMAKEGVNAAFEMTLREGVHFEVQNSTQSTQPTHPP